MNEFRLYTKLFKLKPLIILITTTSKRTLISSLNQRGITVGNQLLYFA